MVEATWARLVLLLNRAILSSVLVQLNGGQESIYLPRRHPLPLDRSGLREDVWCQEARVGS